jgi:multidrug resistance efflux pump
LEEFRVTPLRSLFAVLGATAFAAAPLQETKPPENKTTVERTGTFVPGGAKPGVEVRLGLESYAGALEWVEVMAHGSLAREGDVLARFDSKAVDDAVAAAERDLRSTEMRHQNARDQARLDDEAAAQRIEAASDAANDAQEALANYEKVDVVLKKRGDDLNESYGKDNIDDQKDELAQLEKMYKSEELTESTEEIVLRRSRRNLARTQISFDLQQARKKYEADYAERKQHEAKQKAARDAQRNLDRTQRQVEMEKRARADGIARLEPEMKDAREKLEKLRRDRERFTLRAPASGLVLHGSGDDYRPGRTPPRHEVGGNANAKAILFTIAQPGGLQVALDLPESQVATVTQGMAAKVVATSDASLEMVGRLRFDRFPSSRSAGAPENAYDATVELDSVAPTLFAGMRCKVLLEVGKK